MDQTDLDWLREYCLGAMFYQSQNTSASSADRDRDAANEDRAAKLFDEIQRAMFRLEHSRPD